MMTDEEIVEKVSSFPARIVILTGGEPSLWIDERHTPLARRHRLGDLLAQGERPGGIGKDRRDKGGLYRARPVRIRRNPRTVPFPATLLLPKYERGSGLHPPASPVEAKPANP